MSRVGFLLLLLCSSIIGYSQNIKSLIEAGDKAYGRNDFEAAIDKYREVLKQTPEDATTLFKAGVTLLSTNKKWEALEYLQKALVLKKDVSPEIDYYLGHAYQEQYKFKEALDHFNLFKKKHKKLSAIADHKIEQCQFALKMVANPITTKLEPLEYPINSPYNDYSPLLDSGETTLIFTTARDTAQFDVRARNQLFETIMFSEKISQKWTEPKNLSKEINHEAHDAATFLSSDGKTLVIYYGHERKLFTSRFSGSGYMVDYKNGLWTKPEPLNENINSVAWESSGCFSPDGEYFFFSSDRPGGYGDLDIYMSKLQLDGTWGRAVNLGPEINTPANEDAPFMHADGTLYFSSDGLPGLGNYDIFKTRFRNGKWQKPVNVGFPINTPEYESYFHITPDRKHAYFTSVRKEGVGNTDIFFAELKPEIIIDSAALAVKMRTDSLVKADSLNAIAINNNPPKVPDSILVKNAAKVDSLLEKSFIDASIQTEFSVATEFRGKVIDEEDGKPLRAQIVLVDNKTNKMLTRAYTNPKNGVFIIIIPHGGNYGVSTSCDGYLFSSLNFDVPAFAESQTIEIAIPMQRAEVGAKSVLKNIFFDTGKSDIKKESYGELDRVVDLLNKNTRLKVQINGHTDSSGDNESNKVLSLKRAQGVVDYLVTKGISKERVQAKGFGEERPIVSNDDEIEGREINRRTEIEVIEVTN